MTKRKCVEKVEFALELVERSLGVRQVTKGHKER